MKSMLKRLVAVGLGLAVVLGLAGCGSEPEPEKPQQEYKTFDVANDIYSEGSNLDLTAQGTKNILIVGNDEWEEYTPGHSDLMMLLHVDFDNHSITEVTVPRDTKWQFPDGTYGKLNYVLTNEGIEAQTQAVSQIIGEPIDFYVEIGLDGFEDIVDQFGGIDVDVPYPVTYSFYTNDYPNEYFDASTQTLDGWRAMALARTRTAYSDLGFDNVDAIRQWVNRSMLTTLIESAYTSDMGIEPLFTLLQGFITTNIPLDAQIDWANTLAETGKVVVRGTTGPFVGGVDEEANGQVLVYADPDGWRALMEAMNANGDLALAMDSFYDSDLPADVPAVTETIIEVG